MCVQLFLHLFSYDAPCIHVLSVSFAHFFRSTVVVMSLSVTLIPGACMFDCDGAYLPESMLLIDSFCFKVVGKVQKRQ